MAFGGPPPSRRASPGRRPGCSATRREPCGFPGLRPPRPAPAESPEPPGGFRRPPPSRRAHAGRRLGRSANRRDPSGFPGFPTSSASARQRSAMCLATPCAALKACAWWRTGINSPRKPWRSTFTGTAPQPTPSNASPAIRHRSQSPARAHSRTSRQAARRPAAENPSDQSPSKSNGSASQAASRTSTRSVADTKPNGDSPRPPSHSPSAPKQASTHSDKTSRTGPSRTSRPSLRYSSKNLFAARK